MRARVHKWGNSLAVRIPTAFAREVAVQEYSAVELTVDEGRLVITPVRNQRSLEALLAGITDENIHAEIDFGPPVGNEAW